MRAAAVMLGLLLALTGCTGSDPWLRKNTTGNAGEIARDGRGEPLLTGIIPQQAPVEPLPPASLAGRPLAKPVSCQHFRRCL